MKSEDLILEPAVDLALDDDEAVAFELGARARLALPDVDATLGVAIERHGFWLPGGAASGGCFGPGIEVSWCSGRTEGSLT